MGSCFFSNSFYFFLTPFAVCGLIYLIYLVNLFFLYLSHALLEFSET